MVVEPIAAGSGTTVSQVADRGLPMSRISVPWTWRSSTQLPPISWAPR
jgi:hypothetical protein